MNADEIKPGVVGYVDVATLQAEAGIHATIPHPPVGATGGEPRPLLCLWTNGTRSVWTPLTSVQKYSKAGTPLRREFPASEKTGSAPGWLDGATYLNDGANLYAADNGTFAALLSRPPGAPAVTDGALNLTLQVVGRQARRRENALPAGDLVTSPTVE